MKKLTPSQQKILDMLKDGWTLRYVANDTPYCYATKDKGHASGAATRITTVLAVENAGLIRRVQQSVGGWIYELVEVQADQAIKPVPRAQYEFIQAMKGGAHVGFLGGVDPRYFMRYGGKETRCGTIVRALLKRGFIEVCDIHHGGHRVRLTDAGRAVMSFAGSPAA